MKRNLNSLLSLLFIVLVIPFFNIAWRGEDSLVAFYNSKGMYQCHFPLSQEVGVISETSKYKGFSKVVVPEKWREECGSTGYVSAKRIRKFREESEEVFQTEVDEPGEVAGSHRSGGLEATAVFGCRECSSQRGANREAIEGIEAVARIVRRPKKNTLNRCEPKPENRPAAESLSLDRIEDEIADYSERTQGAIQRAYLALVPPPSHPNFQVLKSLTSDFRDFDSVDPDLLARLLRPSTRDCYRFVKAALSNDYRVMDRYNKTDYGTYQKGRYRSNGSLVRQLCGNEVGDLVERHWPSSFRTMGGGAAHGPLKERGFINLMDSRWGVSGKYHSEASAPEGAVLVYQCVRAGRVMPSSSSCYGDIAIKSKAGYLRDFFTPYGITRGGTRRLVGIYIKPRGNAEDE